MYKIQEFIYKQYNLQLMLILRYSFLDASEQSQLWHTLYHGPAQ